jgi:hypothetical protein
MEQIIIFRDALQSCNIANVVNILFQKNTAENVGFERDGVPFEAHDYHWWDKKYHGVVNDLLNRLVFEFDKFPFVIRKIDSHVEVLLKNTDFNPNEKNVSSYYSIDYFGLGYSPWEEYVNAKIINEAGLDIDTLVAEILWELTYFSFNETDTKKVWDKLHSQMSDL